MEIKAEQKLSEINYVLNMLVIDFDLFVRTSQFEEKSKLDYILNELTTIKRSFITIKNSADLEQKTVNDTLEKFQELIEKLLEVKVNTRESKNEKIALLNQIHRLKNLLLDKK